MKITEVQIENTPMTERMRAIVCYRQGISDGVTHTLEETGKMFGVTRERVRQIEVRVVDLINQSTKTNGTKADVR